VIRPACAALAILLLSVPCHAQGAWTYLETGHVDLGVRHDTTAPQPWRLVFDRGVSGGTGVLLPTTSTAVLSTNAARRVVPSNANFAFLGPVGATIWLLPQNPVTGVLDLGLNAYELPATLFNNVTVELASLSRPAPGAQMFLYQVSGGLPTVFLDSRIATPPLGSVTLARNAHVHYNWAFTHRGLYVAWLRPRSVRIDNGAASVGDPVAVAFLVEPRGWDTWRFENFGFDANGAAASAGAVGADGVSNLLRYALGVGAAVDARAFLPVAGTTQVSGATHVTLTFRTPAGRTDVVVVVEAAGTPGGPWTPLTDPALVVPGTPADVDGTPRITVRDALATVAGTPRFLRLRVELLP
jgi:hypothetical protein